MASWSLRQKGNIRLEILGMEAKGAGGEEGGGTRKHGMVLMVRGGCGEMSSLQADLS